jgi:hypothetical protein
MTVQLFRWDDASAPVLNGQSGSLVNLLDAVLVNGYGAKSAAGWSIAQTTTNKRAYKQGAGGNHPTGIHLYVDDNAPNTQQEARVCGFETMSAITPVGTGQFPNGTQSGLGGGYLTIRKSRSTDSTPRRWYVIADAWTLYLFVEPADDSQLAQPRGAPFIFGDFKSFKTGDAYAQIIIGRTWDNRAEGAMDMFSKGSQGNRNHSTSAFLPGHFCSRHWNQLQVSVRCGKVVPSITLNENMDWSEPGDNAGDPGSRGRFSHASGEYGRMTNPYPNPVDGSLWMSPMYVTQQGIRGYLKGIWVPQHYLPLNPGDTFTAASGNLSGKSFVACNGSMRVQDSAWDIATQVFVEFSNTWPA